MHFIWAFQFYIRYNACKTCIHYKNTLNVWGAPVEGNNENTPKLGALGDCPCQPCLKFVQHG